VRGLSAKAVSEAPFLYANLSLVKINFTPVKAMKPTTVISAFLSLATLSQLPAQTTTPPETHDPEAASLAAELKHLSMKVRQLEQQMSSSAPGMKMDSAGDSGMGKMKGMGDSSKMAGKGEMGGMKDMDMKGSPSGMDMKKPGMDMKKSGMGMKKPGMGMMDMMGEMGMKKDMDGMDAMAMPSALPGFPGASHLYHIGATGFFLNHGEHIELTAGQQTKLNELKEAAILSKATTERKAAEAEQELWQLTAADQPDAKMIEGKIREIEKIQGDQRLEFISAVGKAAGFLTHEQHQALTGKNSSSEEPSDAPTDHSEHSKD